MMRLNEVFINGNFEYINKNIFQAVLGLMLPWKIAPTSLQTPKTNPNSKPNRNRGLLSSGAIFVVATQP